MGIGFVRTDDRFIHGQVTVGWVRKAGTQKIILVNDGIAKNATIQKLQRMSAGPGVDVVFLTEQQAVEKLESGEGFGPERAFLLVENPVDLLALVRAGLEIDEVNLGNLRFEPGKRKITNWIFVNDDQLAALRELDERGVALIAQWVVGEDSVNVNAWLAKHAD
jgi:mannose/fructose/N-acetylgalactosamine-specific phosphotransferase system component IIB